MPDKYGVPESTAEVNNPFRLVAEGRQSSRVVCLPYTNWTSLAKLLAVVR